ncbi:MAG: thioredoxin family protein [Rhodospirillaceae bacterium]
MTTKRKIEIFSAGCAVCEDVVAQVKETACPSCDIVILDMNDAGIATRAKNLGIQSVPSVVIDGKLADCCSERGPDLDALKEIGLGKPLI